MDIGYEKNDDFSKIYELFLCQTAVIRWSVVSGQCSLVIILGVNGWYDQKYSCRNRAIWIVEFLGFLSEDQVTFRSMLHINYC